MPGRIGPWEIVLILLTLGAGVLVFYLLTLRRALERCSPENRVLSPALVWLGFVPLLNVAWQFVIVVAVGRSVGAELKGRGVIAPRRPAQSLGLLMSISFAAAAAFALAAVVLSHFARAYGDVTYNLAAELQLLMGTLSILLGLAGLVLMIAHWVSVHRYSSWLALP